MRAGRARTVAVLARRAGYATWVVVATAAIWVVFGDRGVHWLARRLNGTGTRR